MVGLRSCSELNASNTHGAPIRLTRNILLQGWCREGWTYMHLKPLN